MNQEYPTGLLLASWINFLDWQPLKMCSADIALIAQSGLLKNIYSL